MLLHSTSIQAIKFICKHWFLLQPNLSPDNNGSERSFRNIKVKQKISGQFKSLETANLFAILSSASGIGMIHSCCGMDILMPQVYDKISLRNNKILWSFNKYQPDVVTVCIGQNDGVQDSVKFCNAYINFVEKLRGHYPNATILLLSSPMADAKLLAALKNYLAAVSGHFLAAGDKNVFRFIFSKQSISGCDSHPSIAEQEQIAAELTAYIKQIKNGNPLILRPLLALIHLNFLLIMLRISAPSAG